MRDRLFRRAFRRAFFAAAVVLCLLDGAALRQLRRTETAGEPPKPAVSAEPLTVLLMRQAEEPHTFLLLRLDPKAERIALVPLPAALETAGGEALGAVWRESGGARACAALEETLGAPVDRYLALPDEAAAALLELLGSVDLSLPEGETERRILGGAQLLQAADESGLAGGERLALIDSMARAVLEQRLPLLSSRAIESLFRTAVNEGESDLTAVDFETRRAALPALCEAASVACEIPRMEDISGKTLSGESQRRLKALLSSSK